MSLNLSKRVTDFLRENPGKKYSVREIAEWIFENFSAECRQKEQRSESISGDSELLQQLVREIGSQRPQIQRKTPQIKTTEGRPRKYYYTEKSDEDEILDIEINEEEKILGGDQSLKEHDLYPKLSEYLWSELQLYSKRIDEKKSKNNKGPKGNIWLYPDIVAMHDLSSDWNAEIKKCVHEYSDKKTKLWSFEVKLLVNRANVRQVFFQTVSNSTWANFGYLVAGEIEGADTIKELRMLSALHGIGVIKLETNNPDESQILIPAKERIEIDWNSVNRLANENKDFLEYIRLIKEFYQTGNPRKKDWDIPQS